VVLDMAGNLYGASPGGGRNQCGEANCGVVFKLTRHGDGSWSEKIVHNFRLGGGGYLPSSEVVLDKAGSLYGATGVGGGGQCYAGCGVVYSLTPNGRGKWTYTVLHKFTGPGGFMPGAVTLDGKGSLYGVAYNVVFKITQ